MRLVDDSNGEVIELTERRYVSDINKQLITVQNPTPAYLGKAFALEARNIGQIIFIVSSDETAQHIYNKLLPDGPGLDFLLMEEAAVVNQRAIDK